MDEPKPLRILHCPDIVGGHAQELARAERTLGMQSWAAAWEPSPYRYECDEILCPPQCSRWFKERKRFGLLKRALTQFDVIHFNFGRSLMPDADARRQTEPNGWWRSLSERLMCQLDLLDLPLLKWAGKSIVFTFQGDDARQGDRFQEFAEVDLESELGPDVYTRHGDRKKRRRIARIARWAHLIYALNPDLLRVLPKGSTFLPYANICTNKTIPEPRPRNEVPLILHAPTERGVKGTRHILAAVERLKSEGVAFRFQLVENVSRAEALELYRRADLAIDQLILGWYGGFAVECMALGIPVIAYLRPDDLRYVPKAMADQIPILSAGVRDVEQILRTWLTERRLDLPEIGRRSRAYVERWHDPLAVAGRTIEDYRRIRAYDNCGRILSSLSSGDHAGQLARISR